MWWVDEVHELCQKCTRAHIKGKIIVKCLNNRKVYKEKEKQKQSQEIYEIIIYKDFKLRGFQAAQSSLLPWVCPLECVLITPSYQSNFTALKSDQSWILLCFKHS